MKIHATIELTAEERLALEMQLGGGLLNPDAAGRWAQAVLRHALGDLVRRRRAALQTPAEDGERAARAEAAEDAPRRRMPRAHADQVRFKPRHNPKGGTDEDRDD